MCDLVTILKEAEIEWEPLTEDSDPDGTGIVYTHYRRLSYARLLQGDYPGYVHIQMAQTPELRTEALTSGDISYLPKSNPEEIVERHPKFLKMLDQLRKPDAFRELSTEESALDVIFVGDRNLGNTLRTNMTDAINLKTQASTAGGLTEAMKHDAVLIQPGWKRRCQGAVYFSPDTHQSQESPGACPFIPQNSSGPVLF